MINNKFNNKISFVIIVNSLIIFSCLQIAWGQQKENYMDFGQHFGQKLSTPAYTIPEGPYKPNWESLAKHTAVPKWLRDAKFGIYFHFGAYTVPAYGDEWYPRKMYNKKGIDKAFGKKSTVYEHYLKTYGSPLKFGYPDFIPMFNAAEFNADTWAKLFKKTGAKFAGPVAEHHDGFAMWNCTWTPWNAVDMGPHQDIVGELAKAIRSQGLRFITTFHFGFNNLYKSKGHRGGYYHYVKEYFPSLLDNPKRAILYGDIPRRIFLQMWRGELEELIKNYHPSLMYFDFSLGTIPDSVVTRYLAYYFNKANKWGKQVVVTYKRGQLPETIGMHDYERGRAAKIMEIPWLTSDAIGNNSWGYVKDLHLKSASYLIHELIDIVSKNGQFLLDISPKASGIIPQAQRKILLGIGNWLDQNGQAIYGTRPWKVYGEGPTRLKKGGEFVSILHYTPQDIRYTQKGDNVYAIEMGWPGPHQKIILNAWAKDKINSSVKVEGVSVLGSTETISWDWKNKGLVITSPSNPPNKTAIVYKIFTKKKE